MPALEPLRLRASAQTGTVLGMLIALFGLVNYLANAHSPEIDLSRQQIGRPSEATVTLIQNLEKPVWANVFFPRGNEVYEEIETYIDGLEKAGAGKLLVNRLDHALDPQVAKLLNVRDNGAIFFSHEDPVAAAVTAETLPRRRW